jgi:hypothetical protein
MRGLLAVFRIAMVAVMLFAAQGAFLAWKLGPPNNLSPSKMTAKAAERSALAIPRSLAALLIAAGGLVGVSGLRPSAPSHDPRLISKALLGAAIVFTSAVIAAWYEGGARLNATVLIVGSISLACLAFVATRLTRVSAVAGIMIGVGSTIIFAWHGALRTFFMLTVSAAVLALTSLAVFEAFRARRAANSNLPHKPTPQLRR